MPTKPAPKKIGRPTLPKGEAKGRTVLVRFKSEDLKRIKGAAKASNKTMSEWIREKLLTTVGA